MTRFPTALHEEVTRLSRDFLVGQSDVDTLLVVNSCARGRAIPESDLDLALLVAASTNANKRQDLERGWREFLQAIFIVQRVYPVSYTKWIRVGGGLVEVTRALRPTAASPDGAPIGEPRGV